MSVGRREAYDREMLLAYAAGELSVQDAGAVEEFLARDHEARQFVALYRSVLETVARDESVEPPLKSIQAAKAIFDASAVKWTAGTRPTWIDSLRQLAATLVFDSRVQPALAGYRGGSGGFELGFVSDAGEIDLQAEPAGDDPALPRSTPRWRIIGQVSPNESSDEQSIPAVAVALVNCQAMSADEAHLADADDHGVFSIHAEPGCYDLHVRIGDTVVVIQDVRIE